MTKYILLPLAMSALILSSCSSENASSDEAYEIAEEQSSSSISGAPDIEITAAPGVAFSYAYQFRVPDREIADVQEIHAAACEALGITRCRITGMRYRLYDEERVGASLNFKLDPEIARKFGKDAIASVEKAKGILIDSAIEGIDEGAQIDESRRRSANAGSELKRIEAELKTKEPKDRERTQLQLQAERLRQQLDAEQASQAASQESLAMTPMSMTYSGGKNIPGFEDGNPFSNSWDNSVSSFIFMTSLVMLAIGVILPWAVLIFLLLLLWRSPPIHKLRKKLSDMRDANVTE